MARYAREDHPMINSRAVIGEDADFEGQQNGNVSRLLNQVDKELAIMGEELASLADRLSVVTMSMPTEGSDEGSDMAMPVMSTLAESVSMTLDRVRQANTKIRNIRLGVDL